MLKLEAIQKDAQLAGLDPSGIVRVVFEMPEDPPEEPEDEQDEDPPPKSKGGWGWFWLGALLGLGLGG